MNTGESPTLPRSLFHSANAICLTLAAFCALLVGSPRPATAMTPVIVTDQGPLRGISTPGEDLYLGIPYATPPVGSLRWQPPHPPAKFRGVFHATHFGSPCVQPNGTGGTFGSENCLSLNVYVPTAARPVHGFAVMVWIHGGALETGSGSEYDATPLVEKGGVIVVTINYRLGVLGFFAHPAIDAETNPKANYGLMDQQFALHWVRRNIGAFGGNPNRVTMFGESAGGLSVYSNLASPTAAGLFRQAISESGAYSSFQDYSQHIVPLAVAETAGVPAVGIPSGLAFAASVGCSGSHPAKCLRGLSAAQLVEAQPAGAAGVLSVLDGVVLTLSQDAAFASGRFNRVPVISGSNHDEFRYFMAQAELASGRALTAAVYPAAVYLLNGLTGPPPDNAFADAEIALYPLNGSPTSPSIELGALGTDGFFACSVRNADRLLSLFVPTYAYEFHDETAPSFLPPTLSFPLGDCHFIEVQYLFDLEALGITPTFTPDQQALSDAMIGYWTQFAKAGNPNFEGAPTWSEYSAGGSSAFESLIAPAPEAESDASFDSDRKCSTFWDTF